MAGRNLLLLLLTAVAQQSAHGIHLGVAGTAIAAAAMNFLQHRTGRTQGQTAAAILFRNQYRQIARLGKGLTNSVG